MKKLTPKRRLSLVPPHPMRIADPPPNQTCPECKKGFYSALSVAFRDVQLVLNCPHCRRVQLIEVHTDTAPWKARCTATVMERDRKGQLRYAKCRKRICSRVVYDLPFSVREREGVCPACTVIFHLRDRYKDQMKAASDKAAARLGLPASDPTR